MCTKLASVTIPNGVKTIEASTFAHCHSMTSVSIPNSVTSIGEMAFRINMSLSEITIPEGVEAIGEGAFEGCSVLESVLIPSTVVYIGANCNTLKEVTIPTSVDAIGTYAFAASEYSVGIIVDENFIIRGCIGSTAEKYAKANGVKFIDNHKHSWSSWKTTTAATALKNGVQKRTCSLCKKVEKRTIAKLTPTIKLSATKKAIKAKKSFVLTISKLAKGDGVRSVKSGKTAIAAVKKSGTNKFTITGKKKGKAVITVTLLSGKKATCTVTVK